MKFIKFITFSTSIAFVCALVGIIPSAAAQICLKSDCAALGYSSTATACQNHFDVLKCPFDVTKAVCGGEVKSAGSGVKMFYVNGKLYSVTLGNMGGINYTSANNGCTGKGYRLPTIGEAGRISSLRSVLDLAISIDVPDSCATCGIWTNSACGSGKHQIFYLSGPQCLEDSTYMNGTICVKEL